MKFKPINQPRGGSTRTWLRNKENNLLNAKSCSHTSLSRTLAKAKHYNSPKSVLKLEDCSKTLHRVELCCPLPGKAFERQAPNFKSEKCRGSLSSVFSNHLHTTSNLRKTKLKRAAAETLNGHNKSCPTLKKEATINIKTKKLQAKVSDNNMLVAGPSSHVYQSCIGTTTSALVSGNRAKSNSSVITISSTSSPSCGSSTSNSYNLLKSVAATISRGTEIIKQKVSEKIFVHKRPADPNFSSEAFVVQPTKIHRSSSRCSVDSNDSLKSEIRHFKPIRTAPTTPKKLNSGDILRIPSVRPESVGSVDLALSPNISPLSSINPNLPRRRSAFSVVSSIVAPIPTPAIIQRKSRKRKADDKPDNVIKESRTETVEVVNKKRKVSPPKKTKQKPIKIKPVVVNPCPPQAQPQAAATHNKRVTQSKVNGSYATIVSANNFDCLRKAQLEQERKDFEFAKRVQRQLNQESRVVTSGYSLRRSSVNLVAAPTNKVTKESKRKVVPVEKPHNVQPLRRSTRRSNK